MGAENTLWCIHVYGPDEIIAQPSRDIALDRAAEWADEWERGGDKDLDDPAVRFVVEPWPYSTESHSEALANRDDEYGVWVRYGAWIR